MRAEKLTGLTTECLLNTNCSGDRLEGFEDSKEGRKMKENVIWNAKNIPAIKKNCRSQKVRMKCVRALVFRQGCCPWGQSLHRHSGSWTILEESIYNSSISAHFSKIGLPGNTLHSLFSDLINPHLQKKDSFLIHLESTMCIFLLRPSMAAMKETFKNTSFTWHGGTHL
jgi:hypothetical protein